MSGHEAGAPPVDTSAAAWEAIYQADDAGWDLGTPSPPLVRLFREGALPAGREVLIPGCGSGHEVAFLARRAYRVTGLDFAPSAIAQCTDRLRRMHVHAHLHCGDALAGDLPVGHWDWIFEQTFFCALQPQQRLAYAAQMYRLLKPGGTLLVLNMRTPNTHRQPYDCTPEAFIELVGAQGFQLQEQRPLDVESHPRRRGRECLLRLLKA